MECNHITLDEDEHDNLIYHDLLVDEMHKVSEFFRKDSKLNLSFQKIAKIGSNGNIGFTGFTA